MFDEACIDALIKRFKRVLGGHDHRPHTAVVVDMEAPARPVRATGRRVAPEPEYHDSGDGYRAPGHPGRSRSSPTSTPGCSGVDRVGVDESFFDLGGDSLSAMRAIAAINTALDTQLALPTLFDAPTVASLSQHRLPLTGRS